MKKTIILLVLSLLTVSTIFADSEESINSIRKHQLGLRLGTWSNSGASHATLIPITETDTLRTSINDVNFYLEGFYAYNIYASMFTEISFGIVNRGDIQSSLDGIFELSNVMLNPLLIQLKFFPLLSSNSKFQPFIGAGGGFYFGKQDIQFSNDYYVQYRNSDSETDLNYTFSGGFDWAIRDNFAIELQGKYMPITFSDYFIGEKDYSATTITIGFKFKLNKINNKK